LKPNSLAHFSSLPLCFTFVYENKPFTKFHPPRGFENHLSILFHAFLPVFSALFTPTCFAFAAAFTPSCFFPQLISPVFYPLLIKKHPVLLDLHNNPISRKPCTRSCLPAMHDSQFLLHQMIQFLRRRQTSCIRAHILWPPPPGKLLHSR